MKFKLDDVDHKILDLLIDNSRIPFTDIAKNFLFLQVLFMFVSKKWKMLELSRVHHLL